MKSMSLISKNEFLNNKKKEWHLQKSPRTDWARHVGYILLLNTAVLECMDRYIRFFNMLSLQKNLVARINVFTNTLMSYNGI